MADLIVDDIEVINTKILYYYTHFLKCVHFVLFTTR